MKKIGLELNNFKSFRDRQYWRLYLSKGVGDRGLVAYKDGLSENVLKLNILTEIRALV